MRSTIRKASFLALAAFCLLFVIPASLQAQELRGKISGRVMDPNGAAVPGASVKVIDVERNKTTVFTTNDAGLFDAPYLLPGKYQVLVEVAGFKKNLQDNVIIQINETRTLDITLAVGAPEET